MRKCLLLTCASWVLAAGAAAEPLAADVLQKAGVRAGLAVHVGTTDGTLEAGLAETGRFVVHGLAVDDTRRDRARTAIQPRGLYGLASVETWIDPPRLPYGDRLVNLLVVDADALPRAVVPPEAECLRVLAPKGVLYQRRDGRWTSLVKPRPKEMDDWTHYLHGPESNEVSRDTLIGPQTSLKWVGWYERQSPSTVGAFRAADGVVFHHATFKGKGRKTRSFLVARDAFNGIVLWRRPLDFAGRTQTMVAHHGKLFTLLTPSSHREPLAYVALDARAGTLLKTYELGLDASDPREKNSSLIGDWRAHTAVHVDDRFYWVGGKQLLCVDETSGDVLWRFDAERPVVFPAFDRASSRLFVVLAGDQGRWTRWPGVTSEAVLALDAKTGRVAWRCADAKGKAMGQLTVDGDRLMFFNGCSNLSYHPDNPGGDSRAGGTRGSSAMLGAVRIADGKLLWARRFIVEDHLRFGTHGHWVMSALARDGLYWAMGKDALFGYDRDGTLVHDVRPRTVNNRCIRGRATERFLFFGFGGFIDRDFRWTYQNAARGACAVGKLPANGMTYQVPGECHCFAYVRGFAGFDSEPWPDDIPDVKRLLPGGQAEALYARPMPPPPAPDRFVAGRRKHWTREMTLSDRPLRDAWLNNDLPVFWETKPVRSGAFDLVAVAHEHRLEARQGERVAWSFTADGRISAPPLVHAGFVYVASHDGLLYAVDAASGAVRWRFRAGTPRKMVAHGQLESAQPVTNAVLYKGAICCAAGRHPELDGGIVIWALEPETGAVTWKAVLRRELTWAAPIDREPKNETFRGYQNVALNRGLTVEDGKLKLITDPPRYESLPVEKEGS